VGEAEKDQKGRPRHVSKSTIGKFPRSRSCPKEQITDFRIFAGPSLFRDFCAELLNLRGLSLIFAGGGVIQWWVKTLHGGASESAGKPRRSGIRQWPDRRRTQQTQACGRGKSTPLLFSRKLLSANWGFSLLGISADYATRDRVSNQANVFYETSFFGRFG
jgi:hypothetical protein